MVFGTDATELIIFHTRPPVGLPIEELAEDPARTVPLYEIQLHSLAIGAEGLIQLPAERLHDRHRATLTRAINLAAMTGHVSPDLKALDLLREFCRGREGSMRDGDEQEGPIRTIATLDKVIRHHLETIDQQVDETTTQREEIWSC